MSTPKAETTEREEEQPKETTVGTPKAARPGDETDGLGHAFTVQGRGNVGVNGEQEDEFGENEK